MLFPLRSSSPLNIRYSFVHITDGDTEAQMVLMAGPVSSKAKMGFELWTQRHSFEQSGKIWVWSKAVMKRMLCLPPQVAWGTSSESLKVLQRTQCPA